RQESGASEGGRPTDFSRGPLVESCTSGCRDFQEGSRERRPEPERNRPVRRGSGPTNSRARSLRWPGKEPTARSRLPAVYGLREFAEAGGLISYGPNIGDQFRRVAVFVDKILRGAKPGDLPVEQATRFEVVINLKTAKALGLTIPPSLLARADRVIE